MKLKELVTQETPVLTITTEIIEDEGVDASIKEVFEAFDAYGYDRIVDMLLSDKFGDRELLFTDEEILAEDWKQPVFAYLYPRWRYLSQCIAYLASEYNPIENYSGTEHEETEYDVKQRQFTKGQQANTHLEPTDVTQTVEGQHTDQITPAAKTVSTTTDKQTTTTETAPFESETFYNKDKTTVEGQQTGGAIKTDQVTSQQTADQYNYAQKTDTITSHYGMGSGYTVTDTDGQRVDTEAAHKDKTTRDLTRHGNLGIMVESQMMTYDANFWKNFRWLDEIAHNLAVLLSSSVWSM